MFIKTIQLQNYRNYLEVNFEFQKEGCLITGKNGVGKTNLLEAISYFNYGKSFLNHLDTQIISHDKESFFIKSEYNSISAIGFTASSYTVYYNNQKKKVIHIDNKPLRKISDLYHHIQILYSGADDIYSVFSVPAKRRNFIDMAISKLYPVYIEYLRRFKEVLFQRNSLLKTDFSRQEKAAWDRTFCEAAENVVLSRIKFFETYRDIFTKTYPVLIKEDEDVDICFKPNFYHTDFVDKMMETIQKNTKKECKYQTTLYGPHLDDFYLTINKKNALHFASQGQKRSIVLVLKLALSNYIEKNNSIVPILIFDDTLTELDKQRCDSMLANLSKKHQIFIATPCLEKYLDSKLPILELK